jgi:hypothetical protein
MFLRPFCDFAGGQDHALEQGATALEIEMFVSAIARIGAQAHRQYEIDHIHSAPLARSKTPASANPAQLRARTQSPIAGFPEVPVGNRSGSKLRVRLIAVNKDE